LFVRAPAATSRRSGATPFSNGAAQADQYLYDLDREIQGLLKFPELGTPYDPIRAGYRRLPVKRHLVFYRRNGQRLEIVRVLHDAMDVKSHL
jgi:toxin ParE1/3/4